MSKFAVRALANAITPELALDGVKVTLISPGFVASDIRRVDNRGTLHSELRDPIPGWLIMPAPEAVRQILSAVARGKREAVITGTAKRWCSSNASLRGLSVPPDVAWPRRAAAIAPSRAPDLTPAAGRRDQNVKRRPRRTERGAGRPSPTGTPGPVTSSSSTSIVRVEQIEHLQDHGGVSAAHADLLFDPGVEGNV
jgi:hypothetical protein